MAFVGLPILVKPTSSWVHCASLAMACARLSDSILPTKMLDASRVAAKDRLFTALQPPTQFRSFVASGLAPATAFLLRLSLTTCCSKLEFVALDFASLCLVFWMPSSQGSVNVRRTHQGHDLNVHELMYGVTRSRRSLSTSVLSHEKRSGRQKKFILV